MSKAQATEHNTAMITVFSSTIIFLFSFHPNTADGFLDDGRLHFDMPLHVIFLGNVDAFSAQQIQWPNGGVCAFFIVQVVLNCQFSISVFVFLSVDNTTATFVVRTVSF